MGHPSTLGHKGNSGMYHHEITENMWPHDLLLELGSRHLLLNKSIMAVWNQETETTQQVKQEKFNIKN